MKFAVIHASPAEQELQGDAHLAEGALYSCASRFLSVLLLYWLMFCASFGLATITTDRIVIITIDRIAIITIYIIVVVYVMCFTWRKSELLLSCCRYVCCCYVVIMYLSF